MRTWCFLLGILLTLGAGSAGAAPALPLQLVDEQLTGESPRRVRMTFRHTGTELIAAWEIGCMTGTREGHVGWIGRGRDGVQLLSREAAPRIDPRRSEALIAPGEEISGELPVSPPSADPLEVQACGVLAVVFADRSAAGLPAAVDQIFERRAGWAAEALQMVTAVDRLETEAPGAGPEEILLRLEGALPAGRLGRFAHEVADARERLESEAPAEVLAAIRRAAATAFADLAPHLRPGDLEAVLAGARGDRR